MTKRFIIIALVLVLVCGALFVSCKPDPIKDSKAIGKWFGEFWVSGAGSQGEYFNVTLDVNADQTFKATIESEIYGTISGTWDATTVNKGTLTIKLEANKTLPLKLNFYADEKDFIAYDEAKGGVALVLNRVEPNT